MEVLYIMIICIIIIILLIITILSLIIYNKKKFDKTEKELYNNI
jgi:tellurite resistance protein TehA-like permease